MGWHRVAMVTGFVRNWGTVVPEVGNVQHITPIVNPGCHGLFSSLYEQAASGVRART